MCPIYIEFFPDTGQGYDVVLLHGHDPEAVVRLREQVASLATQRVKRVAIHEIPGFESVADCRLFFSAARWDWNTRRLRAKNAFECSLHPVSWEDVFGLLEPFTEPISLGGFQWLNTGVWGVSIIISGARGW
jgi:hypothetical protein